MAEKEFINFDYFSAGLAESKFLGVRGSFAKAVGIDIHSEPGTIKAQQKLKKDSGATVVDLIMASVHTSSGHSYHFGDAGKIYKRTSGGTWSVLATVTGTPTILGAAEHSDGFVYFTYTNKVGRIQVSNDAVTEGWNTLTNTNTNYGPVIYHEKRDAIFIGNQELVARVTAASAFSANVLDLLGKYEIRDLTPYDIDVLVGATKTSATQTSRIFQWDGTSTSWQLSWFFGEDIKWMINKGEKIFILAGDRGELYDFTDLENPLKKPPGSFSSTAIFDSKPNSKIVYNGLLHFGLFDGSSDTPFPNGVYTYGSKDIKKFPMALNCEYVISANDTTQITIGSISTNGSNLFIGWYDGANYGMDIIDFSNKYASAYIEFLVIALDRNLKKVFDRFPCNFKPMPASCSLVLKQALDHASSFTTIATVNTTNNTDDNGTFDGDNVLDGKIIQLRLNFGVNSNDSPEVNDIGIIYKLNQFD